VFRFGGEMDDYLEDSDDMGDDDEEDDLDVSISLNRMRFRG
jgi:hypothetical protein